MECSITNLAECIPQKIFEFILNLVNAPLQFFLDLVKSLLTGSVDVHALLPFWTIIVYIISLFYGLFLLFSGFNFMISGYNAERREKAKMWMKNVILMILFVQSSFFLYSLILELNSLLTAGIINLIDPSFFL